MGFLDKAKAAADQAVSKTKAGVEELQAKRSLSQLYEQLGRTTHELVDKGEVVHERLSEHVAAIHEAEHHAGHGGSDGAPAAYADAPVASGDTPTAYADAPVASADTPTASGDAPAEAETPGSGDGAQSSETTAV